METDDFNPGDQIIYIPHHAKDSTHPDAEEGFVTSTNDQYVFCRYWSNHDPSRLRTLANSEATPPECLVRANTRLQGLVDAFIKGL